MGKNSEQFHDFRIKEPQLIIASVLLLHAQKKTAGFPTVSLLELFD